MYFEETYNSKIYGFESLDDAFIEGPSEYYDGDDDTKIYDNFLNRILELKNKGLEWDNDDLFLNILNITIYYNEMLLNKKNGLEEVLIKNINENIITKLQLFELEWIKKYDYEFDMDNNSCKIFMKNFIIRIIEWDDDMIVNINLNINENILTKIKWLVKNGCKINDYNIDKFIINVIETNDYNSKNWEFIKILKEFGYEMNLLINNKNLTLENIKFIFQNVNIEKYKKSQIIQSNLKININDFIKMNDIDNVIWCIENGINYDYTSFHTAIEVNNLEIMKILKKNKCQIGIYCIRKAIEYRNIDIIKWVILNAPFDYEVFIRCINNEKSKFKENSEIINILNQIYDLSKNINITHLTIEDNQEIDLSNNIHLTHLTLGDDFNQEIDLSNNIHLTYLTLGDDFNQEIDLSNNIHLTHLTLGNDFNQEIDLSNNIKLTHLTFGYCFNKEINIPLNIKSLTMLGCNNQYIIDNLNNNIEELKIKYIEELNLDNLPNSIKKLYIIQYEKELNNLPNSIEYLELINYNLKIKKIPKNLKIVKCSYYKYIDDFKDKNINIYNQ